MRVGGSMFDGKYMDKTRNKRLAKAVGAGAISYVFLTSQVVDFVHTDFVNSQT